MELRAINALITGGASGIGRAVAAALAARDCRVVIADIDAEAAAEAATAIGANAIAMPCDVADGAAVERLLADAWSALGGIDFAFANAGIAPAGRLLEASLAALDAIHAVNVRGALATCVGAARLMIAHDRPGHLCVTGSEHSVGLQHAGSGHYTASKHAVLGWADVLRAELPATIGLSVLLPGIVDTGLYQAARHSGLPDPDPRQQAFAKALMARGMPAEHIAAMLIRGVADGAFLIPTHGASYAAAATRWAEIDAAYRRYADPDDPDAARYHVPSMITALAAERRRER